MKTFPSPVTRVLLECTKQLVGRCSLCVTLFIYNSLALLENSMAMNTWFNVLSPFFPDRWAGPMSPGASVTVSAYEGHVMGPGGPLTL